MPSFETCPECGAEVPRNAKACPECGSDESTGWSDSAQAGRLGIPEESFDYDQFVEEEFTPEKQQVRGRSRKVFWWCMAVLVLVLFAGAVLGLF